MPRGACPGARRASNQRVSREEHWNFRLHNGLHAVRGGQLRVLGLHLAPSKSRRAWETSRPSSGIGLISLSPRRGSPRACQEHVGCSEGAPRACPIELRARRGKSEIVSLGDSMLGVSLRRGMRPGRPQSIGEFLLKPSVDRRRRGPEMRMPDQPAHPGAGLPPPLNWIRAGAIWNDRVRAPRRRPWATRERCGDSMRACLNVIPDRLAGIRRRASVVTTHAAAGLAPGGRCHGVEGKP